MKTRQLIPLLFAFLLPLLAGAGPVPHDPSRYDPAVLTRIIRRARDEARRGLHPVVVFDLDDTLFDSRTRTLAIFREFLGDSQTQGEFPGETFALSQSVLSSIRFNLSDTLADLGIDSPEFASKLNTFWASHFFSNAYCAIDRPIPGAAKFVRDVESAGARIVYLTGRPSSSDLAHDMSEGTRAALLANRFPTDDESTLLLMKTDPAMTDIAFKEQSFATIRRQGDVIAGFENEPKNINAYDAAFPGGIMVFLDTIHSSAPDLPHADVHWVGDFRRQAP